MSRAAKVRPLEYGRKDSTVLLRVRRELMRVADPRKAPMMQAYMKSAMPYHGVQIVLQKQSFKRAFAEMDFFSREVWCGTLLQVWRGAKYREERYAAIALSGEKRAAATFDSMKTI